VLFQGAGDALGGLAQALSEDEEDRNPDRYGLCITQLKRALRGAAFARGALFSLRHRLTGEQFNELHQQLEQMEQGIWSEVGRLRAEQRADEE
jgi:hypothetical protein